MEELAIYMLHETIVLQRSCFICDESDYHRIVGCYPVYIEEVINTYLCHMSLFHYP